MKSAGRHGARPDGLVEASVEDNALAFGQAHRLDLTSRNAADQVLAFENRVLGAGRRRHGERAERADQC